METNNDKKIHTEKDEQEKINPGRRNILKAMVGFPVAGLLGFGILKKKDYDAERKQIMLKELEMDSFEYPESDYGQLKYPGDLIRIGFIGFGSRAKSLANALGFMHPTDIETRKKNNSLKNWQQQEWMNVAITGICDVFDLHAEEGMATASSSLHPGKTPTLGVKRYRTYEDMLADPEIDAVVIATPDHHHARMAINAIRAGKHIYCEKSPAIREEELFELYDTVKNSEKVYQLGHQITQSVVFQQAKEIIRKKILGKITLIETTTNRNTADGAWIRHLDSEGNLRPGDEKTIDWIQWLGNTPYVPFSIERYYNWTQWFEYDMGMIGQLFTHEFDAVNQLLHIGIPKSVTSSGGIYYWKDGREIPDVLHCIFEYPERELTLLYSGDLASSRSRGRIFFGNEASLELGSNAIITADQNSSRYAQSIRSGVIDSSSPMMSFNPNAGQIDAVTSASEKYYASRGLTTTSINGKQVDVTHLHMREWLQCIRNGGTPSANIEMAFQEGITCIMANRSYLEKRAVFWDETARKII
ncbi:Gfo/Idh/MocA family protein [Phocaeicola oris]|uniref:Gfo/Idh/MocA family protein n=1 Tax=Phocaeicola oris TaxID=2896850 RepID=UPI00234ECC7C|nr:Gfo/Idh/MocA family oxidoreductase [Phocaeicola oris]MCE2616625.1 Gfo/Idh/MocA family oxidoreductase [Phocaeicola oris]